MVTNIATISNVMVAFATLALAFFTYKTIKASEKQLKFLQKQTRIFTSQQKPYLLVEEKEFKGNEIRLLLSNRGEGTAYEVAIETTIITGEAKLTNESERLLKENPIEKWEKLQIQGEFYPLIQPLYLEKDQEEIRAKSNIFKKHIDYEIVYPSCVVSFIFNAENEQSILKPGEENKFFGFFEPYYYVTTKKNEKEFKLGTQGRGFHFNDMIEFLKRNNVKYLGIIFILVSRDKVRKVNHHKQIDSCVVD